ncbi:UNVERIFIED_CONTAM: hypothetical protein K0B97_03100, partial [Spiribacter pallidus]
MSLFEDVSTLFAAAITDGQDNEAIVKAAYEDLLGYADADTMNNSAARIDYWVQKLSSGELTTDNFGGSFLEEANTNQGSLISSTTFENNQTVVAAHEDAYEANPDVTLEDLTAVAAENRVEDVAEEDEGVTGETFTLTTSTDDFTGTANDDTFSATTTDGVQTLGNSDEIDGKAGTDNLFANLSLATTTPADLTNVETLEFNSTDVASTVDLVNATGVEKIENVQSTTALTVNNIASLLSAGVAITSASAATTIEFEDDAVAADDDALTLELDGAGNAITVGSESDADGGIETYNVTATGGDSDLAANALSDSEVETLNVAGTAAMDFGTATDFDAATVIDATENSGGVTVAVGDLAASADRTFTGGSGADDIDVTALTDGNVGDLSVSLGEGDDTLRADDAIDIAEASYDGGDGTDALAINEDIAGGDATYSNFEAINFDVSGVAGTLSQDITNVDSSISTLSAEGDAETADDLTVTNVVDGTTISVLGTDGNGDGDVDDNGDGDTGFVGTLTVGMTSAGTNSLTVDFSSLEGTLTMEELEADDGRLTELTLVNNSGNAVTITDFDQSSADDAGTQEINLEGDSGVTITNGISDNTTAVNAANHTGGVDITGGTGGGTGVTFTGGGGDDSYTAGGQDDTVTLGEGDDTYTSADGSASTVTGGAGADTITLDAT